MKKIRSFLAWIKEVQEVEFDSGELNAEQNRRFLHSLEKKLDLQWEIHAGVAKKSVRIITGRNVIKIIFYASSKEEKEFETKELHCICYVNGIYFEDISRELFEYIELILIEEADNE